MSDSLGLSIGMTNLVAARTGRPPVSRRAIVTLFDDRAPEVGLPSENPNIDGPGMVLAGFTERLGDPVPLVAADGTSHRGEELLAEALESLVRNSGPTAPSTITIAVPAQWSVSTVGALRGAIRNTPSFAAAGVTATLISDAAAALTALSTEPGLPSSGIVALCDFGGTGTSITLADAGARLAPVGDTIRYAEFSGAQIDQALLSRVMASAAESSDADPASTAAVSSLGRLRDAARQAKERLSAETATSVHADLPGYSGDVRITRTELEELIAPALTGALDAVADALQRNKIPAGNLSAVATVGGGAAIPVITQRLSERFRVPVVTTSAPAFAAAGGAMLLAGQGPSADDATGMAPAASADDAATGLAPAAWAADSASPPTQAAFASPPTESAALAWSQDDSTGNEPVAYQGEDYTATPYDPGLTGARPQVSYSQPDQHDDAYAAPAPLPWFRRPAIIFGAAAVAAVLAVGGLAYTLTSATSGTDETTTPTTGTATESGAPTSEVPPTQEPPSTVTITDSNGNTSTSVVPPPPVTTTTTTAPTTTTTTTSTTTTTTTTTTPSTTTTTTPTTTSRTTTTTSVAPPPTTSSILTGVTPPPVEPVDPVDPVEPEIPVVPDEPA